MNLTVAWLAQGKVRIKTEEGLARTVESRFADSIRDRAVKNAQRHSWKAQGQGETFLAGAMIWGKAAADPSAVPIRITSLTRGDAQGRLLYSLETNELCAVLAMEGLGEEERRIWNKNDARLDSLSGASDGAIACSLRHKFGSANIAVRMPDDTGFAEVTEGDSFDTAPRWIPGEGRRLVFQSAGLGRNGDGHFRGLGPYAIQQIDVENGELVTLVEDAKCDLLAPQMTAGGVLYFIRRPYDVIKVMSPWQFVKNVVMFPFRLIYAVYQFLQFFSIRYTGKKLTSTDGTQSKEADIKQMMIWGNRIAAEQGAQSKEDAPSLVPESWQLVRRTPKGVETVLAKGVLSYDLAGDGTIVYSNGSAILALAPDGKRRKLVAEPMIEQVVLV